MHCIGRGNWKYIIHFHPLGLIALYFAAVEKITPPVPPYLKVISRPQE